MENKNTRDVVCKHKDANVFVMTCEEEQAAEPVSQAVEQPEQVAEPVVEELDTEEIAVPIVGEVEASTVEPLGETESWYPDTVHYDSVVNYEYGVTTPYVASLTNPEVGFEPSDIILIAIIALSLLAVVASAMVLTGRAMGRRQATRKDFVEK